jgi:hypothetical protein
MPANGVLDVPQLAHFELGILALTRTVVWCDVFE